MFIVGVRTRRCRHGRTGLSQRFDQARQAVLIQPPPVLGCGNGKTDGLMCFAHSRWHREDQVLAPGQEAHFLQVVDLLPPNTRLEADVELSKCLDDGNL